MFDRISERLTTSVTASVAACDRLSDDIMNMPVSDHIRVSERIDCSDRSNAILGQSLTEGVERSLM